MQPTRIVFELNITDILFTGLMCLAVLFVLVWIIFLQEQIDQWFDVLDLGKWKFVLGKTGGAAIMKINFGFALLVYYTWWLIVMVCLVIILYKLLTNQNFTIGFRVGIQSSVR